MDDMPRSRIEVEFLWLPCTRTFVLGTRTRTRTRKDKGCSTRWEKHAYEYDDKYECDKESDLPTEQADD